MGGGIPIVEVAYQRYTCGLGGAVKGDHLGGILAVICGQAHVSILPLIQRSFLPCADDCVASLT
jgi:hypothetical protein